MGIIKLLYAVVRRVKDYEQVGRTQCVSAAKQCHLVPAKDDVAQRLENLPDTRLQA